MGVSFLCQLEAGHFQNKMIQTLKYISVTHLPTNSMKKSSKISNSKSNQETPQKHTRPKSPIARGRPLYCIKKCYKKLVITKVGSLKETQIKLLFFFFFLKVGQCPFLPKRKRIFISNFIQYSRVTNPLLSM